ncbi:RRM_1 domain-containing protein/U1snRNP70_N domain-containing protein [Cephalotus follicularis]|uniref:RRM_1 domain-containing protein/U1snRNP70_N domain-containing protein n=1 Tax=Cephalotus follicularis TaxID=3775 RepID=A0A1Q3CS22_CEPFO|nr:RRM_1 domain-containing protein/U1snRNP70_N domain-containing protein [Cephalotus follicularis]
MGDYNDAFMRNQNAALQARTKTQNRANVQQLKLMGASHPTGLTPQLLKLFEPRPPLEYKPPPEKRKCPPLTGMGQFVSKFAEPGDPEYAPPIQTAETPTERRVRIHKLRLEKGAEKAAEELQNYDPTNDPNVSGDPYKTLFVARLNYETTESRIKREFESYGPIKRVRLVTDKVSNKPRGYAFIEYVHTRDMKAAYKQADGRKLDGRRVLVDVERGRTVPNWRPRRLGGGLGTTRVGGEEVNQRNSGREQVQSAAPSRSEEPRTREDRHVDRDREKSRERRDKEREREKSREPRERSHERLRDRDHKEHHRDRDRERDKDKDRERGRDRARGRDRGRDHERDRDKDHGRERDRDHTRDREKEKDDDPDHERGRSRDKESDYDRVDSKHERDRYTERVYDHTEPEDDNAWPGHGHRHRRSDLDHDQHYEHYERHMDVHDDGRYDKYPDHDLDRYDQMEEDDYYYGRAKSESRERDREYRRSERSVSRDYDH